MGLFDNFNTRVNKTHIRNLAYVATEQKTSITKEQMQFILNFGSEVGLSQNQVYIVLESRDWFKDALPTELLLKCAFIQQLCLISHLNSNTKIDSKIKIIENIAESYGFYKELINDLFDVFINNNIYEEGFNEITNYLKV